MSAPERLTIHCDGNVPGGVVISPQVYGMKGKQSYTRTDLSRPPDELVEKLRRSIKNAHEEGEKIFSVMPELLAWIDK